MTRYIARGALVDWGRLREGNPLSEKERNIDRVRRLFEAFDSRDLTQISALTDPRVQFLPVTASFANHGQAYLGHDGIARYLNDLDRWWAELRVEPGEESEPRPETVLVLGEVVARRRGSSETRVIPASWVCHFSEGLISSCRIFPSHEQGIAAVKN